MGNCNGPCEAVNKTTLKWFEIEHKGLLGGNPGAWATDTLMADNMSWKVTVPPTLMTGNYVIRHEVIALHTAGATNGAQNYPFCFNLAVTRTGSVAPSSISTETFYTPSDPGILVNIYQTFSTYIISRPMVWSGAVTMYESDSPCGS